MKFKFTIVLILVLASLLRLYQLNNFPPSLNWDEVSIGYNAYSILKTGHDEWGEIMPLSFRAYGDYKLPGYIYLDVPFVSIFDLNELGVRLPAALLGIGLVILIILILRKLEEFHSASWGGFLAAILPWTLIVSRIALEAELALFLTTLGFYLFILGLKKNRYLYLSAITFGLTIFSYNSSRVVTPLLILSLITIFWRELKSKKYSALISLVIFGAFFAIALPNALLQDSSARYKWTTILDQGAINHLNEERGASAMPHVLTILLFNRYIYFGEEAAKNYITYFNPDFLFVNGGSNYQFSVPGSGLLYVVMLPFVFFGFWVVFKERKKWQVFMLTWLLIAPLPGAITRDSPHALRSLMMIPPIIIITSLGLRFFVDFIVKTEKQKLIIKWIIIGCFLANLVVFEKNYFGDYTRNYSWSWQYGYRQAVDYIRQNGNQYQTIYFTKFYGEPHEFVLFYTQYDPQNYMANPNLSRNFHSDWYWVDSFDKYKLLNDWEVKSSAKCEVQSGKCLLVTSPGNYPDGSKFLERINFLDGKPAFDIVEL